MVEKNCGTKYTDHKMTANMKFLWQLLTPILFNQEEDIYNAEYIGFKHTKPFSGNLTQNEKPMLLVIRLYEKI